MSQPLTVSQAAALAGVSRQHIAEQARAGKLKAKPILAQDGRRLGYAVDAVDLDRWMARTKSKGGRPRKAAPDKDKTPIKKRFRNRQKPLDGGKAFGLYCFSQGGHSAARKPPPNEKDKIMNDSLLIRRANVLPPKTAYLGELDLMDGSPIINLYKIGPEQWQGFDVVPYASKRVSQGETRILSRHEIRYAGSTRLSASSTVKRFELVS